MRKLLLILALLISAQCYGQAVIVSSSGDCAGGQPPVFNATTKLYDCQTISTGGTGTLQNGLTSGGSVAYTGSGLVFTVQAASYVIAGVAYTSAQTDVTLAAASGANDRIDAIIVNSSGVANKIDGTPGAPPTNPSVDPTTQLQLTFVYVAKSAATPSNITTDNIYLENTEWTCAAGAGWDCASTTNPYAGSKDIEATTVAAATYTTLTSGAPVVMGDYNVLIFYIRSKATWNKNRSLVLQFYSGATPVGSGVTLKDGTFGYTSSTTASYQQIAIPLQQFAVPSTATVLRITSSGSGGTAPGFYLDNIFLQSSVIAPPTAQPYDVGVFYPGVPGVSQVLGRVVFTRPVTFPVGLTGAQSSAGVAAAASTIVTLNKNGAAFGTCTFGISGATCVFASATGATFAPGDYYTAVGPAGADANLADIAITLAGTR
jgi:hypothetical protein